MPRSRTRLCPNTLCAVSRFGPFRRVELHTLASTSSLSASACTSLLGLRQAQPLPRPYASLCALLSNCAPQPAEFCSSPPLNVHPTALAALSHLPLLELPVHNPQLRSRHSHCYSLPSLNTVPRLHIPCYPTPLHSRYTPPPPPPRKPTITLLPPRLTHPTRSPLRLLHSTPAYPPSFFLSSPPSARLSCRPLLCYLSSPATARTTTPCGKPRAKRVRV